MQRCQQCGHANDTSDRYCGNCGTEINQEPKSVATEEPSTPSIPTQYPGFASERSSSESEGDESWRMSSLGPPPAKKRRRWLWILLVVLGLCMLVCVGLIIFASTGTGQEWLEDLATQASERATEAAR